MSNLKKLAIGGAFAVLVVAAMAWLQAGKDFLVQHKTDCITIKGGKGANGGGDGGDALICGCGFVIGAGGGGGPFQQETR